MAKQSAPIQEVARLLDLVPYISTHSHISLKELASEFGVSEKEMAQELTSLSMCGLPGYTPYELIEVYFDSGFVTINNHETLDIPRALTNIEISSLLIGLSMMSESDINDEKLQSALSQLKEKLSKLLHSSVKVNESSSEPKSIEIQRAIDARRALTFSYTSPVTLLEEDREVEPLSLKVDGGKVYLEAFCTRAKALRLFRLDRIHNLVLGVPFTSRKEIEDGDSKRSYQSHLRVSGRRRDIAEALSIDSIPDSGEVTFDSYSQRWVERAVLAFSPDLTLVSPADSRAQVKALLEKTLALYRS